MCLNRNRLPLRRDFPRLPVNTSRYCVISLRAVLRCAVENLAMSFKLHIFTHDQDIVQIPSKVSIIVYNMYLEASEMCVYCIGCHYIFKPLTNNHACFKIFGNAKYC